MVTLVSSSIDTPSTTAFLPINYTFIASYTIEEIVFAIVDFLLASIVDSLVDLGLVQWILAPKWAWCRSVTCHKLSFISSICQGFGPAPEAYKYVRYAGPLNSVVIQLIFNSIYCTVLTSF